MTNEEIKKAWNTFKRKVTKETELGGSALFYMNAKQLNNRTATMALGYYDNEDWSKRIEDAKDSLQNRKHRWEHPEEESPSNIYKDRDAFYRGEVEYYENKIRLYESMNERFGTHRNLTEQIGAEIINSNAFKEFCEKVGNVTHNYEFDKYNFCTLRIHY